MVLVELSERWLFSRCMWSAAYEVKKKQTRQTRVFIFQRTNAWRILGCTLDHCKKFVTSGHCLFLDREKLSPRFFYSRSVCMRVTSRMHYMQENYIVALRTFAVTNFRSKICIQKFFCTPPPFFVHKILQWKWMKCNEIIPALRGVIVKFFFQNKLNYTLR